MSQSSDKTPLTSKSSDKNDGTTRRRAVALALAAQFALPVGMLSRVAWVRADGGLDVSNPAKGVNRNDAFSKLFGTTRDSMPQLSSAAGSSAELFSAATKLIAAGEYEKAVTALQQVPVDKLNDQDSKTVDDTLSKAREAARSQRSARADLLIGQDAMLKHQSTDAATRFRQAIANPFVDGQTRTQAIANLSSVMQPINADVPAGMATAPTTAPSDMAAPATPPASAPADAMSPPPAPPVPAPVAPPVAPPPVASSPEEAAANQSLDSAIKYKTILQQKNVYEAGKLVDKARAEQSAGQMTEALQDFGQAVKLDPNNQQAAAGYGEVSDKLGLGSTSNGSDRQRSAIQEKIQAIQYHFHSAIDRANTDIDAGKFAEAQKEIDAAQVAAQDDPTLFTQPQINDFNTVLQQTRLHLTTIQSQANNDALDKAKTDALNAQDEKEKRFKEDRERTISGLIQDARQFTDQGKFIEALAVIDNIQKLDPNNAYAGNVRLYVEDKALTQEQRKYRERFDKEIARNLNEADEEKIPYSDIVHYSDDWPTISEERDDEVRTERGEDDQDATLQAQLNRHLPELRFTANSLSDVIDFLRDVTGTNIYVDWPALERASIARDAPVTARLRDIKFSKALELIFKSVEGEDDDHKLGYTLDEGVITISTRKELSKNVITRRYDINDLLFVPPDYSGAPNLSLQSATQGQSAGGGGGGGSGSGNSSIFSGDSNSNSSQQASDRPQRIADIQKYITDNVDKASWPDNGGDVGSISSSPLRAVLLITQTPENHRKIQAVLDSLRASQALQVSVEARFLTVQRNYLEDIGVDANFSFNPLQNPANPRSGYNSSRFTPISINQSAVSDNTTFRDANGNVVPNPSQGSRTLDWISNVGNPTVPGSIAANPADYPNPVVISGSYVDNFTVSFLIRAVQANVNSTSLTAPRLTLFSGQSAYIAVTEQQAYVSGLTPIVAPGVGLFEPTISTTFSTGVVLSVQATVSPDRKYVFMNLTPQLARLRALVPFTISAVVTPVATALGTTGTNQIIQGTLQLPTVDVTQVKTSAAVPDGGTLLLGGETLAAETTREQGVPVLSKIPFLKRLFTNRATSQDEQVMLILVKPTILIQHEQEMKQFPQLSSKTGG